MTTDLPNPYASPATDASALLPEGLDPVVLKKVEAIIKDAGQF